LEASVNKERAFVEPTTIHPSQIKPLVFPAADVPRSSGGAACRRRPEAIPRRGGRHPAPLRSLPSALNGLLRRKKLPLPTKIEICNFVGANFPHAAFISGYVNYFFYLKE
jgi:hypothetical protein